MQNPVIIDADPELITPLQESEPLESSEANLKNQHSAALAEIETDCATFRARG